MEPHHIILFIVLSTLGLANSQSCEADENACEPEHGFVDIDNGQIQATTNEEYDAACRAYAKAMPCLQNVSTCPADKINPIQTLIENMFELACVDLDFADYSGLVQCYALNMSAAEQCFSNAWTSPVTCSDVSGALSCACELWENNCDAQAADGLRNAYTAILSFYHQDCDLSDSDPGSGFSPNSWSLPGIVMVALVIMLTV